MDKQKRELIFLDLNMTKKIRKLKRNFKRLQRMEAHEAVRIGLMFTHAQIKMRPRARMIGKFIAFLTLMYAITAPAASYLESRRADVVIGGHQILVAQALPDEATDKVGLDQTITAAKSPFEFYKPVEGYISQGFSAYHRANDIAGNLGSPVRSIGEGTVEFAGMVYDGHGKMVIVDHGNGLKSAYAHMGRIDVGVGNKVDGETKIGTVGLTGRTTGPHIHMEIIDNGTYVDPSGILPGLKGE
ncbi:MAG: M23 family metallopeptidase [Candidatus Curtissbacteria bacterium]